MSDKPEQATVVGPNQFRCEACLGVFEKNLSDEEAEAQLAKEFPGSSPRDCGLVCDDCYKAMGFTDA